jgi:hypothetical protein
MIKKKRSAKKRVAFEGPVTYSEDTHTGSRMGHNIYEAMVPDTSQVKKDDRPEKS